MVAMITLSRLPRAFIQRPMISSETPPGLPGVKRPLVSRPGAV